MKIYRLFIFIIFFSSFHSSAQIKGHRWNIAIGAELPIGTFGETHFAGTAIQADYSKKRFGQADSIIEKKLGYIISSGISYYFGRSENISGYDLTYSGYFVFRTYGGVIYNPGRKTNISLTAGPALSLYNKTIRFNIGSNLTGTYYFNHKWGVRPGISFIKETGAGMLWSASVKGCMSF